MKVSHFNTSLWMIVMCLCLCVYAADVPPDLQKSSVMASPSKRVYNPVDYGAVPDGQTLCTSSIQKAIDGCAANDGGVVRLSGGKFLSGTIFMKSNITLEIAEGSTLLGSTNLEDYPVTVSAFRSYTEKYTGKSLIYGENLSRN